MSKPSTRPQGYQRAGASGYEKREANAKWIFGIVAFLLVSGLIMHFCLAGVLERLSKTPTPSDSWFGVRTSPQSMSAPEGVPHLQIAPAEDLKTHRAREDAALNSYGWMNRTAGVVRIPVERAMELVLERGLPARSQTNQNGLGPSAFQLQQQRPQSSQPEIQGGK